MSESETGWGEPSRLLRARLGDTTSTRLEAAGEFGDEGGEKALFLVFELRIVAGGVEAAFAFFNGLEL